MRSFKYLLTITCLFSVLAIGTAGCDDGSTKTKEKKSVGKADTSKGHGHDHVHIHGPMGGEVFDIPGTDMKLEVVAKYGQDLLTFAVYESDIKTLKKVKCEGMTGRIAAAADKEFEIEAVNTEDGMASKFEIENADIAIAYKTTGIKLEFEIDGKKHSLSLPKDPHG